MSTVSPAQSPSRPGRFGYLAELWRRREFIWYLTLANIRSRHAATSLGLVWWVLSPLLLGLVFWVAFGVILDTRRGDPNYIGFLLSGLFAFYFTRSSITGGAKSLRANLRLIMSRQFPRLALPIAAVLEAGAGFVFSLIPFYLIVGFGAGDWPLIQTTSIVLIVPLHAVFNVGLTSLLALVSVPFRDVERAMTFALRLWLYMSPVLFPLDIRLASAPSWLIELLRFNPLAPILGMYRWALLGREMEPYMLWGSLGWALVMGVGGLLAFRRFEDRMVRYLL